jgi:two-component system NtrC family sensor kinase
LPAVIADQHQLEQVFLNIINNAVDAILEAGKGGKLRVSCSLEHGRVVVQFHDSGPGLADPSRVFDPFYTTKQIGKGTGLGLSICYGIVKEHGGEVVAFNHAEGGAVFQIRLPAARRSAPVVGKPATDDVEHDEEALVNCRVLVVDDEDSVREFEREVLAGAGAEVTAIRNGHDAAEQLRRHSFDVLLFDGKMPGRYNGAELCRWLAEHRPDLLRRVILTVSDAADPEVTACVNSLGIQCLAKPFEVADLLRACRTAIENKSHQLTGA